MKKRRVLVPLDGSEFSRQIVRVVRTFFDPSDVDLVLFRAAYPPSVSAEVSPTDVFSGSMPSTGSYETYSRAIEEEYSSVTKERETFRTELVQELNVEAGMLRQAGYEVSIEVQFGDPAERIVDFVQSAQIDLVAMTTHGRTGLGRLVLGSVAERVLRGVAVPVLLMRSVATAEAQTSPGEQLAHSLGNHKRLQIVAATDGSTLAQRALGQAVALSRDLDANLAVLAAVSDRTEPAFRQKVMESIGEELNGFEPRPVIEPLVGYADETILEYLERVPADMLMIGPFQDRGTGAPAAMGPIAQRLVQHAPTSVYMHKGSRSRIRKILCCVAVDDTVVVDVAAQIARATGAELQIVHVIPPSAASYLSSPATPEDESPPLIPLEEVLDQGTHLSTILKSWIEQLREQGFAHDIVSVQRGSVPEALLKRAHDGDVDLLIVGSGSGPGHFLGSIANSVVRYATQSTLVVRTRPL